jgi:hypothetical protein
MQNKLGQLNCAANAKNTGFSSCFEDFKQIFGAFIFDAPRTFSAAELAALQATLSKNAISDSKTNRMFPVHNFLTAQDGSEKVIVESFDYGSKYVVRDGDMDWTFQFVDGGNCLLQALRTHNGKRWILFYDKENKLLGYNNGDGSSLSAIPMQFFYAHPWTLASGSKTAGYMLQFVFLPKYINELRAFIKAPFELSDILGLQDINIMTNTFNQNSGLANVTLQTDCGAVNIYDLYNNQLTAASLVAQDNLGNVVRITSLTKVPGTKTFNVQFNPLDILPANGPITLSGAPVSVLNSQLIVGYEIRSVNLVVVSS